MITRILDISERLFDRFEHVWHSSKTERIFATMLVVLFTTALAIIELRRQELLPGSLMDIIPTSHYHAINIAFSLLLVWEVIGLVFALTRSMSDAVGKQFEILALIMLRDSFKYLIHFEEPIKWQDITEPVLHILAHAGGALIIFALLFVYYRIQKYQIIINDEHKKTQFIKAKKLIAIILLIAFNGTGAYYLFENIFFGGINIFFDTFYTILIFSDILIVLVSLRYTSTFHVVFRNSAFTVTTLIIRLALTAPVYIDVLLGIFALLYGIGLVFVHNLWVTTYKNDQEYIPRKKRG